VILPGNEIKQDKHFLHAPLYRGYAGSKRSYDFDHGRRGAGMDNDCD
jgi:hypothetical protein